MTHDSFVGPRCAFVPDQDRFYVTCGREFVDPATDDSWLRSRESHGCLDAPEWTPAGGHRSARIGSHVYADAGRLRP